ncbi:uncharacterized protein LOC131630144 [Vicia villosa]|uniref:uncharacterized protein LOC131630144 n=1 Tax=Vicia villosa TaxID=3911 RepID=UPI00273ABEDF|nr:uncharacterized protein LOC131630144 [Vicia villosa]
MVSVQTDQGVVEGVDEIKGVVRDHFEAKFKKQNTARPTLNGIDSKKLSEEESSRLEENFTREEIKNVVWSCQGDDVVQCVLDFHSKASLPKAMPASFIALIPKVEFPLKMDEYRPICHIGEVYKIISKMLAARLAKVIEKLISKTQTAFIPERQILDGILVTNEIIDYAKRKKK